MGEQTKGGYESYEVISAMQKCIRRGDEKHAFYWAMEMIDTGGRCAQTAFKRLWVTLEEDIGIADPIIGIYALPRIKLAQEEYLKWVKGGYKSRRSWEIPLTNAILSMCRAKKTRFADWFKTIVFGKRAVGYHPEIPDYALDKHTQRGKTMGRGLQHFVEEGCVLQNENLEIHARDDIAVAAAAWRLEDKGIDLKSFPEERNRFSDIKNESQKVEKLIPPSVSYFKEEGKPKARIRRRFVK